LPDQFHPQLIRIKINRLVLILDPDHGVKEMHASVLHPDFSPGPALA
jgi:hypothetical protein